MMTQSLDESWLSRKFHKLLRSTEEMTSEELVSKAVQAGAVPIVETKDRERVTVQGTVSAVTINPQRKHSWLEIDISDGSGVVTLIWMGHGGIGGITPGRSMRVQGLLSVNEHGRRIIRNPSYELL